MQVAVKESYYDVPKYAMSAEIENNKDEEGGNNKEQQQPPKKPLHKKLLEHWQIGIKLIELIFSAISIGFIYEPIRITNLGKTHLHHVTLIYGTYVGYSIINCIYLFSRLLRDRFSIRTQMIFTSIATILFTISGILLITDKRELTRHSFFYPHLHLIEMLIISATFSLLNGLVYLIDTILTYKYAPDVE